MRFLEVTNPHADKLNLRAIKCVFLDIFVPRRGIRSFGCDCLNLRVQMDDNGQRENRRHKADQYKSMPTQWMMPQHQMKDHHALKLMTIMTERDKAIQDRNLALSEKKAALAERDMAILQRDAAISERNAAIMERDNALATLKYARENGGPSCPPQQHPHHFHSQPPQLSDAPYNHSREMHISEAFPISAVSAGPTKAPRKPKRRRKETKAQDTPPSKKTSASKSTRKNKGGGGDDLNKEVVPTGKQHEWKVLDLGLNRVTFDDSTMPVPVCSCTGKYQQCYKWGSGGWQSACCTMTLSMYPLPVMPNRRHARVGGRKMSGAVFNRLLSRLASEGHDLSLPLDLKDHWAKHGTNRYITIK